MKTIIITLFILLFAPYYASAQLEKVIVEKYYVSDSNDATDVSGGGVPVGSTTYRIYLDLKPGTILKRIYGDANHPFSISSSEVFFNNILDGQTFGKDFIKGRYLENTVHIDDTNNNTSTSNHTDTHINTTTTDNNHDNANHTNMN